MISIGTQDLVVASLGTTNLAAISLGAVDIWTAWTDTRVDKTTTQTLVRSTWVTVTWNTTTGDPVAAGEITISGGGQATITGTLSHLRNLTTNVHRWRLIVDGNPLPEFASASGTNETTTLIPPTTVMLGPGSRVRLEVYAPAVAEGNREILAGSFMTITAA